MNMVQKAKVNCWAMTTLLLLNSVFQSFRLCGSFAEGKFIVTEGSPEAYMRRDSRKSCSNARGAVDSLLAHRILLFCRTVVRRCSHAASHLSLFALSQENKSNNSFQPFTFHQRHYNTSSAYQYELKSTQYTVSSNANS